MAPTALVVGSTGIVGQNLAARLVEDGWTIYGLARNPLTSDGVQPVAADLLNPESLATALKNVRPTHVFFNTWLRQATEAENIRVNGAMVRNLLDVVSKAGTVEHVGLVTGLKHYLGPFESYGKGTLPPHPFAKTSPVSTSKTFTMPRKTKSSPPPRATASVGVCSAPTPSSVTPWETR